MSSCRGRADPSSAALSARFHAALRAGDVSSARELAFRFPSVVRARDSAPGSLGATPVMSAVALATADAGRRRAERAVALVDMLVAKGASLQAKDERKRHALMVASAQGAHPLVLRCLSATRAMDWGDADADGRTALMLACANGHGGLAAFALDKLLAAEEGRDPPMELLRIAVESKSEQSALELLRARRIERAVVQDRAGVESAAAHGQWSQVDQTRATGATLTSCVAAAVENGMSRLVARLHALNPDRVGRATWLTVHRLRTTRQPTRKASRRSLAPVAPVAFPPGILRVVEAHKKDVVWKSIRLVFLVRHERVRTQPTSRSRNAASMLVTMLIDLPDDAFRIVVSFLKTPFDDDAEAQKEQFRVLVEDAW